jgi:hypothetical protein
MTLQEIMVYLTIKLNKKKVILTFGQFDHLVILDKLNFNMFRLVVFFIDHKMVSFINQIG